MPSLAFTNSYQSIVSIPDMSKDWRFANSPSAKNLGLRSYAGTQLVCRVDEEHEVAFGSLCVASNTAEQTLDAAQQQFLAHFAQMLTEDIVNASRRRRAQQQQLHDRLLRDATATPLLDQSQSTVLALLKQAFPDAQIAVMGLEYSQFRLHNDAEPVPLSGSCCIIYEDDAAIDDFIQHHNHEHVKKATRPVRAIIGTFSNENDRQVLAVMTNDMTHIFDDIDLRFVASCTALLNQIAREKALQDAIRTREDFMRGITHQLRTPLHGILGSADLLETELTVQTAEGSAVDKVRMIKESGRDLIKTVNDIIRYNRWTDTIDTTAPTVVDLDALESEILQDVSWYVPEDQFKSTCILFRRRVPNNVGIVVHGAGMLKDCLQTLLLNALQNTEKGCIIVDVSAPPDFTSIAFEVLDTGRGIALADQQRIFTAYGKADVYSRGAGLGLTLACKAAKALRGDIVLKSSEPGKGSCFRAEFQNQAFVCPLISSKLQPPAPTSLPKHSFVVQPDPPCQIAQHLATVFHQHGVQESCQAEAALCVVAFSSDWQDYQKLLDQAQSADIAVSMIPAGTDTQLLSSQYPDILFVTGPFTSARLEDIVSLTNNACAARLSSAIPKQTTFSLEIRSKGTDSTLSDQLEISQSLVPRCLLVDDNAINVRLLSAFCNKLHLPYEAAFDGLQAIEQYKNAAEPIKLILLDLQMPRCGGIEACEAIRAYETANSLSPAVILIGKFSILQPSSKTDPSQSPAKTRIVIGKKHQSLVLMTSS